MTPKDLDAMRREKVALTHWLHGRKFFMALEAMDYAGGFHTGTRKDGYTPEFAHQINIANNIRNMEANLIHPEETIATVFLHDVMEDFDVPRSDISRRFGQVVADASYSVTKVYLGVKRNIDEVFDDSARNPIGSVVKGGDRSDNQGSMIGVFKLAKQREYLEETDRYILPMLKRARKLFPSQEPVYNLLKHGLVREMNLIRAVHAALDPDTAHRIAPDIPVREDDGLSP